MRIDPNIVVSQIAPTARNAKEPAPSAATPSGPATVVSLSANATAVDAASPGITTRLQNIRAMIDKGDYPIDLDKLASRIVDDDVLRGGRKS